MKPPVDPFYKKGKSKAESGPPAFSWYLEGFDKPSQSKAAQESNFKKVPSRIRYFHDKKIRIRQISCAKGEKHIHTACITEDYRVFMWGDPYKGQLGLYIDEKGWTHEEKSLYPIPLELNLDFLKHPPI